MKTFKVVIATLVAISFLTVAIFFLIGFLKPKQAGIKIETLPSATIYLNGVIVGKTPFEGVYKPGETLIKLVPDGDGKLLPFETKVKLLPGIKTLIRREFGTTEDLSSGDIISFDNISSKDTSLIAISIPENAQISLDGVPRGFTPYKTSAISPAEHQITIKAPGYNDRVMKLKTLVGYRLTIFVKLAKSSQNETLENPKNTLEPAVKKYVEILKTPTGFLRVRTQPGTKGEEIAEVKPGQRFLYLETDPNTAWNKIQYQEPRPGLPNGITGWVSGEFSKVVEESANNATGSANTTI
ncbi:MAG: PEGA domain-containing protein [Candidatus Woesebacteria bacterium]|nr:MAG: PEGA domain-containing protein [Candidatus Woesebacteria bacterium]